MGVQEKWGCAARLGFCSSRDIWLGYLCRGGACGEGPCMHGFGVLAVPGLFGSHCAQSHWSISIPKYLEHLSTQNFWGVSASRVLRASWHPEMLGCLIPMVLGSLLLPTFGGCRVFGGLLHSNLLGCFCTNGPWSTLEPKIFGVSLHPGSSEHFGTQNCRGVSYLWSLDHPCTQSFWGVGPLEHLCTPIFWGCLCTSGPWSIPATQYLWGIFESGASRTIQHSKLSGCHSPCIPCPTVP